MKSRRRPDRSPGEKPWRIHWAWVPAAVFVTVIGWTRYGWWTLAIVASGLAIGIYAERKARKRRAAAR